MPAPRGRAGPKTLRGGPILQLDRAVGSGFCECEKGDRPLFVQRARRFGAISAKRGLSPFSRLVLAEQAHREVLRAAAVGMAEGLACAVHLVVTRLAADLH